VWLDENRLHPSTRSNTEPIISSMDFKLLNCQLPVV